MDDGIGVSAFVFLSIVVLELTYGTYLLSRFKKLKFPKRNYIHFFRNPNQQYEN